MECKTIRIKSTHPESQGPFVEINATDFDSARHERFDAVPVPALPPLPVLPPAPVDPLAGLAKDWREGDAGPLRKLAATVSGRTVENKAQAVAVIEAELAKRG